MTDALLRALVPHRDDPQMRATLKQALGTRRAIRRARRDGRLTIPAGRRWRTIDLDAA